MILSKIFSFGRIAQRGALRAVGTRVHSTSETEAKEPRDDNKKAKEWSVVATSMMADSGGVQIQTGQKNSAVVLVHLSPKGDYYMSKIANKLNDDAGNKLKQQIDEVKDSMEVGKAFVVADVGDYSAVALAFAGPSNPKYTHIESLETRRECARWAVAAGVRALQERGAEVIEVDTDIINNAYVVRASAEGAELAAWQFNDYKSEDDRRPKTEVKKMTGTVALQKDWDIGRMYGEAQNWARFLSDTPANKMTPIDLAQEAINTLCPLGVKVVAHDRAWIEAQHMEAFLAVARGSCEEPVFLECELKHTDGPTVLVAAKGVTFDSGGLCLKEREHMVENRGSMAGAAAALGALKGVAELKKSGAVIVPLNVTMVIPLCENMISGQCMKVGDVVRTLNGLNVVIEDTDMEGRLMLADALVYGQAAHRPEVVIDVATLTHGIQRALGSGAFGAFTNDEELWQCLLFSGSATGDRPWRLPLWDYYQRQIDNDPTVDLRNRGSGKGSPCLGAAFLKNFVCGKWIHMDTTGVGKLAHEHDAPPYLIPGRMSGRPTRMLITLMQALGGNRN